MCGCDAPVAEGSGDASSPASTGQPKGAPEFSRDEGVARTFCDGASQLRHPATASSGLNGHAKAWTPNGCSPVGSDSQTISQARSKLFIARAVHLTSWLVLFFVSLAGTASAQLGGGAGWGSYPVTFKVQWPTNAAEDQRYWFTNNIYHCELFSNDGAFSIGNRTLPRTEQRFMPDYTNGEIQYQSMEMAPSNENSYCVFQIHTGNIQSSNHHATTFMLFWFADDGGSIRVYDGRELAKNLGNQWFQLNVDHNLANRTIRVWINQSLVWTQKDNGAGDFYFKDGVYEQRHGPTSKMDTYIANVQMWTNSGDAIGPLSMNPGEPSPHPNPLPSHQNGSGEGTGIGHQLLFNAKHDAAGSRSQCRRKTKGINNCVVAIFYGGCSRTNVQLLLN